MKKIIIVILIVLVVLIGQNIIHNNLNKEEGTLNQNELNKETKNEDVEEFKNLIQYKTESASYEKNLKELLKNMELGEYVVDIERNKEENDITIYYDCTDEENIREYFSDIHKVDTTLEKNFVTLFALVNNLQKVTFKFDISNSALAEQYNYTLPTTNEFMERVYSYTREEIENNYNQDVRSYVENPNEFMKYNIDLNSTNITIYTIEKDNNVTTLNINDTTHINKIIQFIKTENFKHSEGGLSTTCSMWLDLNNGYIIGLVGEHQDKDWGYIIKGDGKEILKDGYISEEEKNGYDNKILPTGIIKYVKEIIEDYK